MQGRGIGQAAMDHVLDVLRTRHQAQEVLIVYSAENDAAEKLYRRMGFVEYDRRADRILAKLELGVRTYSDETEV